MGDPYDFSALRTNTYTSKWSKKAHTKTLKTTVIGPSNLILHHHFHPYLSISSSFQLFLSVPAVVSQIQPFQAISSNFQLFLSIFSDFLPFPEFSSQFSHYKQFLGISSHFQQITAISVLSSRFQPLLALSTYFQPLQQYTAV